MDQMRLVNYQNVPGININKTVDTGTTIFDQDGGYAFKILGKDDSGNVIATKYKLLDVTKSKQLSLPDIKPVEDMDGNKIQLTPLVQELIGPGMFHIQDTNVHTIETAINVILRNQAVVSSNMNEIIDYLKQLTPEQLSQISQSISEVISNDYYDKSHTDKFERDIRQRMQNIEARFPNEPNLHGYTPPNYIGNIDSNDDSGSTSKLQKMKNELEGNK